MKQATLVWLALGGFAMSNLCGCKQETQGPSHARVGNCAAPIPLDSTPTLTAETTAVAERTLSATDPTCLGVATLGPEQVYQITVPVGGMTRLQVTVTPAEPPGPAAFDPVVYLMRDCVAPPVCVAAADRRGGGSLEAVEHTNTSGLAENLFLAVDGYDYQPEGGAYRLAVELVSP
jgi:hypothetical protein